METRKHIREIEMPIPPEGAFAMLHTPSAIRAWWGAARVIVVPEGNGFWAAEWGDDEDDPEYVMAARIAVFDPPRRLRLEASRYYARSGPLPFAARFTVEFTIEPRPAGCILRVVQDGFPMDPSADAFYAGCEQGWRTTFAQLRDYIESNRNEVLT